MLCWRHALAGRRPHGPPERNLEHGDRALCHFICLCGVRHELVHARPTKSKSGSGRTWHKSTIYRDLGYDFLGGDHGSSSGGLVRGWFPVRRLCVLLFVHDLDLTCGWAPWTFRNFIYRCFSTYCGRALRSQTSKGSGTVAQVATVTCIAFSLCTGGFLRHTPVSRQRPRLQHAAFSGSSWGSSAYLGVYAMPLRAYRQRLCQMANALAEPERAPELVTTSLVGLAVIFTATGYVCNFAYQDPANPITVSLIDEFGISVYRQRRTGARRRH